MRGTSLLWGIAVAVALSFGACADDIPRDKPGFTNYLTSRLQLYTHEDLEPRPDNLQIRVTGTKQTIDLVSTLGLCSKPKADCQKVVDEFVQQTVEEYLNLPKPDVATMHADWFLRTSVFSIVTEVSNMGDPVQRVLGGMMTEHCFIDPARRMHELRLLMLNDLKLEKDDAFDICERNLRATLGPLPDIYFQVGADHIGMVEGSNYEAARVVLLDQWVALWNKFGQRLIVAAPASNIVVFSDADDDASVAALLARAKQIFKSSENAREYDVYEFNGRRWRELTHEERGVLFKIDVENSAAHVLTNP